MKVLSVATLYAPVSYGGAEIATQLVAEGLAQRGVESCVVTLRAPGTESYSEINGVRVLRVSHPNSYELERPKNALKKLVWHAQDIFNRRMQQALVDLLRREKPDIVHTGNIRGFSVSIWQAAVSLGIPVVHTLHDFYLLCPKTSLFRDGKICQSRCGSCSVFSLPKQYLAPRLDAVIGVSRFTLDRHTQAGFFRDTPIQTVIPTLFAKARTAPSLGWTGLPRPLRLGFLGRLEEHKGIEALLRSTAHLPPDKFTLQVAGTGDRDYVNSLIARYASDRVQFVGFVEPEKFLRTLDLLVAPSLFPEPLGRVLIEANSVGIPVLTTRNGGIPEYVIDGKTGFLVHDEAELKLTLQKLVHDPSPLLHLGPACLQHFARFSGPQPLDQHMAIYREITSQRKAA